VLYKIDGRSGDVGRIVWRMEPKQERPATNRGAALWGNLVISPANGPARIVATDKETGKVVWETNMVMDQPEVRITAAPLALKDKIIVGASGGDSGVRDWVAGLASGADRIALVAQNFCNRTASRWIKPTPRASSGYCASAAQTACRNGLR
jgi:hypothetical protein